MKRFQSIWESCRQALSSSVLLMLICGLGFPLLLSGLGAVFFPSQAQGSLVEVNGSYVGSAHVGQEFTEPWFMKGRPSAVHYNTYRLDADGNPVYSDGTPFGGLASGSHNYGPSNPALLERIQADTAAFLEANPEADSVPGELITASGSGLDPHISPAAAEVQIPALSKASGLSEAALRAIIRDNTEGKLLGVFGAETVNVLGVNIDIAEAMGIS